MDMDMADFSSSGYGSGNFTDDFLNDTCTAITHYSEFPYSMSLSKAVRYSLIIYNIITFLVSILLNSLLIYLVCRFKSLQTISFVLVIQVIIINMVATILLIPLTLVSAGTNSWLLGKIMCTITGVLFNATSFVRLELMLVFVIDRHLLVFTPFSYPKYRYRVVCLGAVASYVFPIVLCAIPAFFGCYAFSPIVGQCQLSTHCSTACASYIGIVTIGIIIPSCTFPFILYACLYVKAKNLQNQVVPTADAIAAENEETRREWRATFTFFLMFVTLFLITAPSTVVSLIGSMTFITSKPPLWYLIIETILSNLSSLIFIMDPIVLMRNTDVKEVIARVKWIPQLWC